MKNKTIKIKVTIQDLDFIWGALEYYNNAASEEEDKYEKIPNRTKWQETLRQAWDQDIKESARLMEKIELIIDGE